jgi:uracil-DNA glycosylase
MKKINPVIESSWLKALTEEFEKLYFLALKDFLIEEKKRFKIYPPGSDIFAAFNYTPFDKVKVVILGQDPYHGSGQAHGLCFSVNHGVKKPPSLQNIFKELQTDIGISISESGNLKKWAQEGVLLLNATLTVRSGQAGSHQNKGWELFTDAVIRKLSDSRQHLVFILWGNYAIAKEILIDPRKHLILKSAHPSPFSAERGFYGSRPFSKTNDYLTQQNLVPVNWDLNDERGDQL